MSVRTTAPGRPRLIAVAHGSRDPRSAATIRELTDIAAELEPGAAVRPSFLDLSTPGIGEVLARSHDVGANDVVVAPLLLGNAYHARSDLPALLARSTRRLSGLRITTADILGIDPALEEVALDRIRETGVNPTDDDLGIVLTAVGSSHPAANDGVREVAARWQETLGGPRVCAAFAAAAQPGVPAAIARLRAAGARRIVVASWFLAPGLLPDRITRLAREADPAVTVAAPLGAEPRVARVLLDRYAAASAPHTRTAAGCARLSA